MFLFPQKHIFEAVTMLGFKLLPTKYLTNSHNFLSMEGVLIFWFYNISTTIRQFLKRLYFITQDDLH